jgi:lipoprotein-anchoring transpeptidase ErfK/SrfK
MARKASKGSFNNSFFLILLISVLGLGAVIANWKPNLPCANTKSCKESLSLEVNNNAKGYFMGQTVAPPQVDLTQKEPTTRVLGDTTATGEKHIYVDLTTQTLIAYQGDTLFMTALVATGKWFPTPDGEFTIWEKIRATRMSGGEGADAYDLPNVPWVMFFSGPGVDAGRGFSLHGAYWHDNFGHPMSHGCVNMRQVDAQKLYDWADPVVTGSVVTASKDNPGTKITIYGQPPL